MKMGSTLSIPNKAPGKPKAAGITLAKNRHRSFLAGANKLKKLAATITPN
jgi:hypothetical protein